jgi:prepilin-type processing-associated H-X9-DG protein
VPNAIAPHQSAHARYGFQYWAIILVLNVIAALTGRGLGNILFVDGVIAGTFGVATIATRIWPKKIWVRRDKA